MSNRKKLPEGNRQHTSRDRHREPSPTSGDPAGMPGRIRATLLAAGALGSVAAMALPAGAAATAAASTGTTPSAALTAFTPTNTSPALPATNLLRLLDAPADGILQPSAIASGDLATNNNPLVQLATNNIDPDTGKAVATDAPTLGALANLYDPANPLASPGSQSTQPAIPGPSAPAAGYIRVWDPTTDNYMDYSVSGSGYIPVTPNSVIIHSDGTVDTPQLTPGSLTIPPDAPGLRFYVPSDYTPPTQNFLYPGADGAPAGTTTVAQASGGNGAQPLMVAATDPTVASPPSLLSPTPLSQAAVPLTAPQAASPQLFNPAPLSTTPAPLSTPAPPAAPLQVASIGVGSA